MFRTLIYPSSGIVIVEEYKTKLMSLFYFTSYVLNMFRTLMYPSSGACDCVVELPHRSFVLGSLCVGDLVRLGLSSVRVATHEVGLLFFKYPCVFFHGAHKNRLIFFLLSGSCAQRHKSNFLTLEDFRILQKDRNSFHHLCI